MKLGAQDQIFRATRGGQKSRQKRAHAVLGRKAGRVRQINNMDRLHKNIVTLCQGSTVKRQCVEDILT